VIQLSELDAVQSHPLEVVTLIGTAAPPPAAIDCVCGVKEYPQAATPAACVIIQV
jgi:hypothetical protein